MKRLPRAFRSLSLLLAAWICGRAGVLAYDYLSFIPAEPFQPKTQGGVLPDQRPRSAGLAVPGSIERLTPRRSPRHAAIIRSKLAIASTLAAPEVSPQSVQAVLPARPAGAAGEATPFAAVRVEPSSLRQRWAASSWLIYRAAGGSGGLAPNGQLGGSQAGARVWAGVGDVTPSLALGVSLRASAALRRGAAREVAPGVALRVSGPVPLEVIAERRIAIGGNAPDRFALLAASGFDDVRLPRGLLGSGYAQAGVAGLSSRSGSIDGAARIEKPLLEAGGFQLRAGANAWGAAQPGLSRLDVGPSVTLKSSTLGVPLRISAEWRGRVAGNAGPGSGPALGIDADF